MPQYGERKINRDLFWELSVLNLIIVNRLPEGTFGKGYKKICLLFYLIEKKKKKKIMLDKIFYHILFSLCLDFVSGSAYWRILTNDKENTCKYI